MIYNRLCSIALLFSIALSGCEIPEDDSLYRASTTHNVNLNGNPSLLVQISQAVYYGDNCIKIDLSNVSNDTLFDFTLVIDFYRTSAKGFNDLMYTYERHYASLEHETIVSDTVWNQLNVLLEPQQLEITTLSNEGTYSKAYTGYARFLSSEDSAIENIYETRGYIDSNGNLLLRVNNSEYVNRITGLFENETFFDGSIVDSQGAVVSNLIVNADSYTMLADPNYIFRFGLNTSFNNTDSLFLDLH